MDSKTLEKIEKNNSEAAAAPPRPALNLHSKIRDLVAYLFQEATDALTSTVNAKITAQGIQTPLGILTIGQIEKGESILSEAYEVFKSGGSRRISKLEALSGEFYTVIPHRIGRSRDEVAKAVLDTMEAFAQKQETLQLMKDMLKVNGEHGNVLHNAETDAQYESLNAELRYVEPGTAERETVVQYVAESLVKTRELRVHNVYQVRRPGEDERFTHDLPDQRWLFHGSRVQNWVGLLTRGILLPKIVIKLGVNRTDAGWLGNGIYFGDAACTSAFYTTPGRKKTRFLAVTTVALGRIKEFYEITYGLSAPPDGYDSCWGVRRSKTRPSQFDDDEYVVYSEAQQKMDYLVEFTA